MTDTAASLPKAKSIGQSDRRFRLDSLGLTLVLIALIVLFTLINPRFASWANMLNVLTQASTYVIVAMGMTLVITKGGIDLSVGALMALVTCVAFGLIEGGMHFVPALGADVPHGHRAGRAERRDGGLPRRACADRDARDDGGVPGLRAAAFGRQALLRPAARVVWLGQGTLLGIPVPILIAAAFVAVTHWLFNLSRFGVHVRAVGGNREAARLSGIKVWRIEMAVYAYIGFCRRPWRASLDGPDRRDAGDAGHGDGDPRHRVGHHRGHQPVRRARLSLRHASGRHPSHHAQQRARHRGGGVLLAARGHRRDRHLRGHRQQHPREPDRLDRPVARPPRGGRARLTDHGRLHRR
jgi:hypothetical protein